MESNIGQIANVDILPGFIPDYFESDISAKIRWNNLLNAVDINRVSEVYIDNGNDKKGLPNQQISRISLRCFVIWKLKKHHLIVGRGYIAMFC